MTMLSDLHTHIRTRTLVSLATLNFFLADARDGMGPFLDAWLVTQGWTPFQLGLLATSGGIIGLLGGIPAGALVDATRFKRSLIIVPVILTTLLAFACILWPTKPVVFATQALTALAGLLIGPAMVAISLGLVGRKDFGQQVSHNEAWSHTGNIVLLIGTWWISSEIGLSGVATLMILTTAVTVLATLSINADHIDHEVARGQGEAQQKGQPNPPSQLQVLWSNRVLLVFALTLMLFHFGNAPISRLLIQQFALNLEQPFKTTAIIMIVGQVSAIAGALLAPAAARHFGLRHMVLFALATLPVRGVIAAQAQSFDVIYPVQILDGLGAGLLGILTPLMLEKLLAGTGHFNLGFAAVLTVQGIGATLSSVVAGMVVQESGYGAAFLFHGLIALLALLLFGLAGREQNRPPLI
ncbi:MFS transporter [Serratia plymuthica]|uniref:MFS transporter n=1 Tax=Serratia plymuthica TaxID=82996 RepID=UPI0007E95E93|nr:MFS transporter [Serratia plymuthica]ANJ97475.1 MFS transporter permease [Serratia plymuthica]